MNQEILRAEAVSFRYPAVPVLEDVSLIVSRGDFSGVVGSNGAGKSTFMKLLLAELAPQTGSIRWFGEEIGLFRDWTRIGYLPQSGAAAQIGFPATALEVVLANLHKKIGRFRPATRVHREEALAALARVGVADLAKRMLGELSGGQLQRVMLARVLVSQPDVLLLDEPTTGVDREAADSLFSLLAQLNRDTGLSILMVTHDIDRIASFAGRLYFMEDGRLIECDDDFHRHPPHRHSHRHGRDA